MEASKLEAVMRNRGTQSRRVGQSRQDSHLQQKPAKMRRQHAHQSMFSIQKYTVLGKERRKRGVVSTNWEFKVNIADLFS